MPLNIKDEAVHRTAKQLAALTGESLTSVVRQALDERLAAVLDSRQTSKQVKSADKLMALARQCAAHMPKGLRSADHGNLYDDNGMPR